MIRVTEDIQSLDDPTGEILGLNIIKDKEKVKKQFKDSIGLIASSKATDLTVNSEKELKMLFFYLLRRALGADAPVSEAFSEYQEPVSCEEISTLLNVSKNVITHSARVADILNPVYRFVSSPAPSEEGIVSSDVTTFRPFYWVGNAAVLPKKYIWTTDFVLNENGKSERTCFLSLIADEHKPTIDLLGSLKMPDGSLEQIISHSKEMVDGDLPDYAYRKQVLVPEMNDDDEVTGYLAITPMASIRLFDDLGHATRRFRERHTVNLAEEGKKEKPDVPFYVPRAQQNLQFGGSNAQNVSDFAGAVGGYHPALAARIPKIRNQKNISETVEKGRLLLNISEASNTEAGFIARKITHFKQEASFRRDCKSYLDEAVRPVFHYAKVIQKEYDNLVAQCKESGTKFDPKALDVPMPKMTRELHLMTRLMLIQDRFEAEQVDKFAKVFRRQVEQIVLKGKDFAFTERQGQILKEEIEKVLRDWTCPVRRVYG